MTTSRARGRTFSADKERAVRAALGHPKAEGMSDRQMAEYIGVHFNTVASYRHALEAKGTITNCDSRTGADGRTINTANIGRRVMTKEEYDSMLSEQMSMVRGRRYNRLKKAAHAGHNQHTGGGGQNDPQQDTSERLAAEHGVSASTIERGAKMALGLKKSQAEAGAIGGASGGQNVHHSAAQTVGMGFRKRGDKMTPRLIPPRSSLLNPGMCWCPKCPPPRPVGCPGRSGARCLSVTRR